ncbi:hypothetical protein T4B_13863 [Trichinella pseudospiralis]|uniref:Uncharacterized protein n=1 Tax=Trichinella pseudospiralis TaxID=6337 RepID=A0A0V1F095_TRIPS|nr:hypothetical protein T4A_12698 [Trichinella pseudospiralis]KRZ34224.1 hypothetical protein T4B_13863 [Trichinella pseudospiralis]KRZ45594.1 hypothetical protein T4C_7273 [Trichinella pseudospiralis]
MAMSSSNSNTEDSYNRLLSVDELTKIVHTVQSTILYRIYRKMKRNKLYKHRKHGINSCIQAVKNVKEEIEKGDSNSILRANGTCFEIDR